jgi:hypothetical protein
MLGLISGRLGTDGLCKDLVWNARNFRLSCGKFVRTAKNLSFRMRDICFGVCNI